MGARVCLPARVADDLTSNAHEGERGGQRGVAQQNELTTATKEGRSTTATADERCRERSSYKNKFRRFFSINRQSIAAHGRRWTGRLRVVDRRRSYHSPRSPPSSTSPRSPSWRTRTAWMTGRGGGDHDDHRDGDGDLMPHTCHYSKPDRRRCHPRIPGAFLRPTVSEDIEAQTRTDFRARLFKMPPNFFWESSPLLPLSSAAPFFLFLMHSRLRASESPSCTPDNFTADGERGESGSDSLGGGRDSWLRA